MSLLLHVFDTTTNAWVPATNDLINSVKAVGYQKRVSAEFTRPSNTTAYGAMTSVSNSTSSPTVLTFSGAGRSNGGSGTILTARHIKSSTTITPFRLYLYRATIAAINDGSAYPTNYANRVNRLGHIDFNNHQVGGTGSDSSSSLQTFVNLDYVCDAASTALIGRLVAVAGYTPPSGEQHTIELGLLQN
jgi:hypothetical protein